MNRMGRPLFMKTYGKHSRKLDAWLSPDNRKLVFATTSSSDLSFAEPTSPEPAEKRKKKSVASSRWARPAKSKALGRLKEKDSDEENVFIPPPLPPHNRQQLQSNTTRKGNPVSRPVLKRSGRKVQRALSTSESEGESTATRQQNSAPKRRRSSTAQQQDHADAAPLGRFVTNRRRGAPTKPKASKNRLTVLMPRHSLNSSDDFIQGGGGVRVVPRPATRRRRLPIPSTETSLAELENTSVVTHNMFLREISLNESTDRSLGPCSGKPLCSSTPSSRPFARPRLLSDLDSDIISLSTTQEGIKVDLPEDPLSPATPAPLREPSPGVRQLSALGEGPGEAEGGNCGETTGRQRSSRSRNRGALSQNGDSQIQSSSVDQLSLELLSPAAYDQTAPDRVGEETEDSGHFVSAAGGQEWLAEAVKQRCLTKLCVVRLERADILTATQPHGDTTYSSCLDHIQSVNSVPSINRTWSVHSGHSIDHTRSVNNGQSIDHTLSTGPSDEEVPVSLGTKLKESCLTKHCTVRLEKVEILNTTQPHQVTTNNNNSSSLDRTRSDDSGQSINRARSANSVEPKDHTVNSDQSIDSGRSLITPKKQRRTLVPTDKPGQDGVPDNIPIPDDIPIPNDIPKRKKAVAAPPKERKRRSVSGDRPRTTRKACVSGVSVSRWGRREGPPSSTHTTSSLLPSQRAPRGGGAGDCSIVELLAAQHTQAKVGMESWLLGPGAMLGTPVRVGRLNLSSVLANLTPGDTHTWSRLKAALSIHRKSKVFLTPQTKRLPASLLATPRGAGLADVSQDLFATPHTRHLHSQLVKSTPLSVCEAEDEEELSDAEKVYAECGQEGAVSWEECLPPQRMKLCKKIGEGTFGEVFSTTNHTGETVALKIIPVEGSERVNGEEQKTFREILHEMIISKELSSLKTKQHNQTHGFIGLNSLHCVRGGYPAALLKAWDSFNRQRRSENDRPDFFEAEQLFLILEFEFGGSDLENMNGKLQSLFVARSILHQVTAALAVAEQELRFEHRDLHWGNVLVRTTKEKEGTFLLDGTAHSLETRGVHVRIIDYSLSRLEIDGLTVSCDISEDDELFMGQGDYQFDIYRLMRQENSNCWGDYQPHSNVLWLHYLCSKLLCMKYRSWGGRGVKEAREELTAFHDNLLKYTSATHVLEQCSLFQ